MRATKKISMHEVSREIDFDVSNTLDTSNEHVFLSLFFFLFGGT